MRLTALLFFLVPFHIFATSSPPAALESMEKELDFIQYHMEVNYAPAEWKYTHSGWDLATKIEEAKADLRAAPNLSFSYYHQTLRRFFDSTHDYHVKAFFSASGIAYLPLELLKAGNRYFVVSTLIPEIDAGDEVVACDGVSMETVIERLVQRRSGIRSESDYAEAIREFSLRNAAEGVALPDEDEVILSLLSKRTGSPYQTKVEWIKIEEEMPGYRSPLVKAASPSIPNILMMRGLDALRPQRANTPFALGSRTSYLPPLGDVVKQLESPSFDAYIFKDPRGRKIGYLRIATYSPEEDTAAEDFQRLINQMERETHALVIDQINNPGGYVTHLYGLLSMLTDRPLYVPSQTFYVTPDFAKTSVLVARALEEIFVMGTEQDIEEILGFESFGFPLLPEHYADVYDFFKMVGDEWAAGNRVLPSIYLYGISKIPPHPKGRYSKPIVVLINEQDYSSADFFPAILQDNKRATLFGVKTAGAGGAIGVNALNSPYGVVAFSSTFSLAHRLDGQVIEDLGVTPDVVHELTVNDIQYNFVDYRRDLMKTLNSLLK